jgi:hypothetical protein
MAKDMDRLYDLLPVIYRQKDAEKGYPLRALLQVIAEQVNLVVGDIDQLYENWFIETCQDWVVPYIGDLVGYRPVHESGEPGPVSTARERKHNKILIPRPDVANTVRYRRRKGALALLEQLAWDVAGWPSRAVEFYSLLSYCQPLNQIHLNRGQSLNLRNMHALDNIDGPFDEVAHIIDVRRVTSHRTQGRYNIPGIGVFVWPVQVYSVTRATACCPDINLRPHCFTFNVFGIDVPLFTLPDPETDETHIAEEMNLPVPITRHALRERKADYYGEGRSIQIWREDDNNRRTPVPPEQIVVADLRDWGHRKRQLPVKGRVALDPELGRIAFHPKEEPKNGVTVTYYFGFSADIGGGEYERSLSQAEEAKIYRVGTQELFKTVKEALEGWKKDKAMFKDAVIEIAEGDVYDPAAENDLLKTATIGEGESLQIRVKGGRTYLVGTKEEFKTVKEALEGWKKDKANRAKVEDDVAISMEEGVSAHVEEKDLAETATKNEGESLQIRAEDAKIYRVGTKEEFKTVSEALEGWKKDKANRALFKDAVIEIMEGGVYGPVEERDFPETVNIGEDESLQIRAASGVRPIIRMPDRVNVLDYFTVENSSEEIDKVPVEPRRGGRLILDGLIAGQSIRIRGNLEQLTIRHCTIVPGKAFLELEDLHCSVNIEHCIMGSIRVSQESVTTEPLRVNISDSILDTVGRNLGAISNQDDLYAHALLRIERCTVLGRVMAQAIDLAENCIFADEVQVIRSQQGCMRFCYVRVPADPDESKTPRRYHCQPDLVMDKAESELRARKPPEQSLDEKDLIKFRREIREARRLAASFIHPQFWSTHFGDPGYVRLARPVIPEIWRGADDESEMGVFHDLFQPQREANLKARLEEYAPAGMNCGIIWAEGFCKPEVHILKRGEVNER